MRIESPATTCDSNEALWDNTGSAALSAHEDASSTSRILTYKPAAPQLSDVFKLASLAGNKQALCSVYSSEGFDISLTVAPER